MKTLAIDPGSEESAFVVWDGATIHEKNIVQNVDMMDLIMYQPCPMSVAIEMVECYGMAVGKTVFETVFWVGRFWQAAEGRGHLCRRVFRSQIKLHHCRNRSASDSNIRQALVDRFGEPGTKKQPGALYGVSKDMWSALAIAVFCTDNQNAQAA